MDEVDVIRCEFCGKLVDPDSHDFEHCADPYGGDGPED